MDALKYHFDSGFAATNLLAASDQPGRSLGHAIGRPNSMRWILPLVLILLGGLDHVAAQVAFAPTKSYVSGAGTAWVVAADINRDGRADLIAVNTSAGALGVLTNNGNGGFGFSGSYPVGAITAATAADVNGDGSIDLIAANKVAYGPGTLVVYTNDGTGRFALSSSLPVGNRPQAVTAADMNGDGWVDLISANASDNTLSVLTNDGRGDFALSAAYAVGNAPFWVIAADVNGDGSSDLICANYNGNTLSVLTNDGAGGFALCCLPSVGLLPLCVVATDVNGDGQVDLVSANSGIRSGGNSLTVLTNDGRGGFILAATCSVGNNPCAVVATDLNADGKVDLACANFQDNNLSVLTNNGNGAFTQALTCAVGVSPRGMAAADVNGDGRADLISANLDPNNGTVSVLVNIPTLTLKSSGNSLVVSYPFSWTNWVLLQTPSLSPATWSASTGLVDNGKTQSLTILSPTNNQFFRLAYP